jgi:secretion/DNA translocation related TadE-like protein
VIQQRFGPSSDRGSATIWVLACCAVVLAIATVATVAALGVLARHRAESGADLAALAAAARIGVGDDECQAAAAIARRNGAEVRRCRVELDVGGRSGTVRVRVAYRVRLPLVGEREVVASARAARLPPV